MCVVGRIDVGNQRLVLWDLGGQQDLQTLWNEVKRGGREGEKNIFRIVLIFVFLFLVLCRLSWCSVHDRFL